MLRWVERVWNAVVLAEHGGSPDRLEHLRRACAGTPLAREVEALVERKRIGFGADPRRFAGALEEASTTGW